VKHGYINLGSQQSYSKLNSHGKTRALSYLSSVYSSEDTQEEVMSEYFMVDSEIEDSEDSDSYGFSDCMQNK